ncbi:MAG: isocitrate lyase/phosphoenolpyruvate mutase family protein [Planctomycetota bacterium]|nr:isocitrate lyase/phosphoenolpyruvate mutase family protein [Planctomycetota bacterium]
MTPDEQRSKAKRFLELHHAPAILKLPNAWDVVSAKIFQLEGYQAIATTSAGVAATLGYPDGQRMSLDESTQVTKRLADCIDLPISADIEAGYADDVEGVVRTARITLEAGAVGINLEDSSSCDVHGVLMETPAMVQRVAGIRMMADEIGIPLVINARTDVYLTCETNSPEILRETISRANAYRAAGADCIFIPDSGILDEKILIELVREIDAPLNVIVDAHLPSIPRLEEIGIARISMGPRPMRAVLARLRIIARELMQQGTCDAMTEETMSYAQVNSLFER